MDDDKRIRDHVAGATVQHDHPFRGLDVPARDEPPARAFIERWIQPFYMSDPGQHEFAERFTAVRSEVDEALIGELLAYRNWRPRIVGAYLAAIYKPEPLVDLLGKLLLRSDVCYAGRGYCLALAAIGGDSSIRYLERYLDYYLTRPDLWFDQGDALAALDHLDRKEGAERASAYTERWKEFTANKPGWSLRSSKVRFRTSMDGIEACQRLRAVD